MKRRDFFLNSALGTLGIGFTGSQILTGCTDQNPSKDEPDSTARNIIFLVSDGMSSGTLQMADLLSVRKYGRTSNWMRLYQDNLVRRAIMDTASANSIVTDSAAASSSWGGGVRVKNGRLNIGDNNEKYKPILQKFKDAGKAVGCVTSVPITHATPAGFCVNNLTRADQPGIALDYLRLRFDVMLGGGSEFFDAGSREDGRNLFEEFRSEAFQVAVSREELMSLSEGGNPVLGAFHTSGIPYALDHIQDAELVQKVPSLAEMTRFAIDRMKAHENGFVLQVEGGKVDWAAHGNDAGALLYDQLAFDEAIGVAMEFAEADKETLVIITTDHGNANPGLLKMDKVDQKFDTLQNFRQTNEWVLRGLQANPENNQIIERIEHAAGIAITKEEAGLIKTYLGGLDEKGLYNPYKLPFALLADILKKYTGIGWAGGEHTGDYVELAMTGPGSEMLKPFVKNTDLHNFILTAVGVEKEINMS